VVVALRRTVRVRGHNDAVHYGVPEAEIEHLSGRMSMRGRLHMDCAHLMLTVAPLLCYGVPYDIEAHLFIIFVANTQSANASIPGPPATAAGSS
jgi:hypothetical protein